MPSVPDALSGAYGEIASTGTTNGQAWSSAIGYSLDEQASVPAGADLGLGCGNPLAVESIRTGETVLDLGSGAGFDCFLAADRVGPTGKVIGVDMTPEMVARAQANAERGEYPNVEFRLGRLEELPVVDGSVDVVTSNCVICLVPNRRRVFTEAFRVLKPGGRLTVSDTLVTAEMPDLDLDPRLTEIAYLTATGTTDEYVAVIAGVGFTAVRLEGVRPIPPELAFDPAVARTLTDDLDVPPEVIATAAGAMVSVDVTARKPE